MLWHLSSFVLTDSFETDHLLGVVGRWGKEQLSVTIVNVHAPCDLASKIQLWREIVHLRQERGGDQWCVGGDFNSILSVHERKGVEDHGRHEEMAEFAQFISDTAFFDLPLIGRKYTWYRANGSAMSRLDCFLVSDSWLNSWVDLSQWGLPRSVSDHCPVVLRERVCNWGPKPFRLLDCWRGLLGYREFVTSTWMEAAVNGRKAYVLKEKLKQIKNQLRVWNKDHCGDISHNIDNVRKELDQLDKKQEDVGLEEHDIARRRTCLVNFNRLSRMHCNLLRQKSRFKWLREGDSNSKFFHSCLAKKRRRDEILCLDFGGELVDEVQELKGKVKDHFQSLFAKSADWDRPHIDSLPVGQISEFDGDRLVAAFSEDEMRAAVWDCEGQKSPGPNGINFFYQGLLGHS